jgi:hypothetical protein
MGEPVAMPRPAKRRAVGFLRKYFYLAMALAIPLIVAFGFSFTVRERIIDPAVPRPTSLYIHSAVFTGWLFLFLTQTLLVRIRWFKAHRYLGWIGAAYAVLLVWSGAFTALEMARFNTRMLGHTADEFILIISLWDMVVFTIAFGLAIYWRRKPPFHRRLMYIAVCEFTPAAFGRIPFYPMPLLFYVGMDCLILLGMARDWIDDGHIHRVYLYALPLLLCGQAVVMYTISQQPPFWYGIAHNLLY